VTLSVSDGVVTDTLTRTNYITVTGGSVYTTTTRVITYTYDKLYRLTDADYSSGESFAYAYDPVGNRTVHTRTLTATTVITYAYDAANRLVNVDGVDYTWDANGNLLSDGVRTFTYDAANRLTSVTSGTLTTTFEYDGLGNRMAQTVDGVTTEYVLDVAGGLPEVIVATTGGAGTRYVQAQGQILAEYDSGAWGYVLPDHLGSVRQVVDAAGEVTLAYSFDPFGVPFETSGSGESDFGYTGEWWDAEAGLLYLRVRYYDPMMGRFLSEDTKPGIAYQPKSLHIYTYAWNNPVLLTDPSGLQPPPPARRYLNHPTAEEVVQTSSSNVLGLIRLFEMDHFPGSNARERLQWILGKTATFPGSYIQLSLFPPGDSGFCEELADERFYTDRRVWGEYINQKKHKNVQMGHFLIAVALGFNPEGAYWQAYFLDAYFNRGAPPGRGDTMPFDPPEEALPFPEDPETYALSLIVGHEMVGDREGVGQFISVPEQYYAATEEARTRFRKAVEADRNGHPRERDEYLQLILGVPLEAPGDPQRVGNSMPDLRLSVKGWRFGQETRNGEIDTRQQAADWLRIEIYDPSRLR
jgi:RHS repeat-associated protein